MSSRMNRRAVFPVAASLAVLPLSVAAQATPDAVLAEEQATRLLRRYIEDVVIGRNHDAFDTLITADIAAQDPTDADGRDALWQRMLDGWAEQDDTGWTVALTIEDLFASGGRAAARLGIVVDDQSFDEDDATGDIFLIAHVADGKIARLWSVHVLHND